LPTVGPLNETCEMCHKRPSLQLSPREREWSATAASRRLRLLLTYSEGSHD
jgi:hypothetical protein